MDVLTPYDLYVEGKGQEPLKPFTTGDELLEKSILTMEKLHPVFADNLRSMKANNRFDLNSRQGKAPGGYNCPMPVSRYPFIFMNAAGTQNDLHTFMHEGGHAMHSFCAAGVTSIFNHYPMEIAEVASMSMELMSMYFRGTFYENAEDLKRAQK
ncbi:hypothetical protein KBC03_06255 [Patescibacteria group bacterium]|nr:hypothetical protein [Patescibacteria group bacterium]